MKYRDHQLLEQAYRTICKQDSILIPKKSSKEPYIPMQLEPIHEEPIHESFRTFFKKQVLLERSNITYVPPQNKRLKMFDFYVLTYIKGVAEDPDLYSARGRVMHFPEALKVSAIEAANSIVESLAKDFSRDVLFSICSEMRHCTAKPENLKNVRFAEVNIEGEDEGITRTWPVNYLNWKPSTSDPKNPDLIDVVETMDERTRTIRDVKTFRPFGSDRDIRQVQLIRQAYKGVSHRDVPLGITQFKTVLKRIDPNFDGKNFSTRPIRKFVEICSKLFLDQSVFFDKQDSIDFDTSNYAGRPWSDICEGWLRLDNAKNIQEKAVAVDHIYDLQHNNGSVFTKLKTYEIGGAHEWLTSSLDEKRDITDFYDLIVKNSRGESKISSDARTIALKVLHLVKNTSEEQYIKSTNALHPKIRKYIENGSKGNLDLRNTPITNLPEGLTVGGYLDLAYSSITSLPEGLKVGGSLTLAYSPITSLPVGLTVGGDLALVRTPITSLQEGLTVGGSLRLTDIPITSLPKGLKVGGSLTLTDIPITSLPEGLTVGGSIFLSDTPITSLPKGLTVEGCLSLHNTKITSLPEGLTVRNGLYLSKTPITSLPKDLKVEGGLNLAFSLITSLPEGLTVSGSLTIANTNITSLPEGLTINGSLHAYGSPITSLPGSLKVGDSLYLRDTSITSLPDGLKVGADLDLSLTPITSLPDGLKVGADLDLRDTKITSLPEGLTVGGSLYLTNTPIIKKYTPEQLKQMYPGIRGSINL